MTGSDNHLRCGATTLAISAVGAMAGVGAGLPLPYMLGPLLFAAFAALAGLPMLEVPLSRQLGQAIVGLGIGLRFTPAVGLATVKLFPAMIVSTGLIMLATTGAAVLMRRISRIDHRTAFLATAAAGAIEMSVIAARKGADSSVVSVTHLIRMITIVATIPFLVTIFGAHGNLHPVDISFESEALPLIALIVAAIGCGYLIAPLRFPNSWFLVPVIVGAVVAGFGFGPFAVPSVLVILAQIAIGTWLGSRFQRDIIGRLPRVTMAAFVVAFYLIIAGMSVAWLLTLMTDLSFTTAVLAVAPGGVTEMVLTATAMHLDAATVTAFQLARIAVVMSTIQLTYAAFVALTNRL